MCGIETTQQFLGSYSFFFDMLAFGPHVPHPCEAFAFAFRSRGIQNAPFRGKNAGVRFKKDTPFGPSGLLPGWAFNAMKPPGAVTPGASAQKYMAYGTS